MLSPTVTGAASIHSTAKVTCGVWSIVPSPKSRTANAYLNGVAGTSDRDVWAVGSHSGQTGNNRQTLIRHWNGNVWSAVASPNVRGGGDLSAVVALSPKNAWAVGGGPLIEHWNGVKWSVVPSPQPSKDPRDPVWLRSIAAVSATDIWAVGTNWSAQNLTLIEHWDGKRWSIVPGPGASRLELNSIAVSSPTDIRAVGFGGGNIDKAAGEHWNGIRWVRDHLTGEGLVGVAAVSSGDVWAVGGGTTQHWNGTDWSVVPSPSPGTQFSALTGIAAVSTSDIWTVGLAGRNIQGDGYAEHPIVEHWNGSAWSLVPTQPTQSPDSQLLSVAAVSARTVWAVGFAGLHRGYRTHTLIERYTYC